MNDELKEQYCRMNGWIKVEGYKIDVENCGSYDYEYLFVEKKDSDLVTECFFWKDENDSDESCYDNIDELIEYIEENTDVSFEDFKKGVKCHN